MMKVKELIELLQQANPDKEVFFRSKYRDAFGPVDKVLEYTDGDICLEDDWK